MSKHTKYNIKLHHPRERCEGSLKSGACINLHVPGSKYCVTHGGNKGQEAKQAEIRRMYRLKKYAERVGELAQDNEVKGLREEIGILRMMLEETLNQCNDTTDLLLFSSRISDLVIKIEKLVVSCNKLENSMGLLLNKSSIIHLADMFVNIINIHVEDPAILETIGMEMMKATDQVTNVLEVPA